QSRIGNRPGVEAVPFVFHSQGHARSIYGDLDAHVLSRITPVAVQDGVGQRFRDPDTEVEAEPGPLKSIPAAAVDEIEYRSLDHPQVAGELDHELRAFRNCLRRLLGRETW